MDGGTESNGGERKKSSFRDKARRGAPAAPGLAGAVHTVHHVGEGSIRRCIMWGRRNIRRFMMWERRNIRRCIMWGRRNIRRRRTP